MSTTMTETKTTCHVKPEGNAHWYDENGNPVYEQPYADKKRSGEMRPTTKADARKLFLCPGGTGIIGQWAAPGLEAWKQGQMIEAAATCPRLPDEPDTAWMRRVVEDGREAARLAADKGTRIHKAIEGWLRGLFEPVDDDIAEVVAKYKEWHAQHIDSVNGVEKTFCRDGYGGKVDMPDVRLDGVKTLADLKTKNTKPGKPIEAYDEWGLQLVAYSKGLNVWGRDLANIVISRTEPGRIEVFKWEDQEELWELFQACFKLWRRRNKFDPRARKAVA